MNKSIILGITGASGAIYARETLRALDADARVERVHLVITEAGMRLLTSELGINAVESKSLPAMITGTSAAKIQYHQNKDIGASIASGSFSVDAMVVIPCSAGTLADIACGTAGDLLARSADVCLKERRPLILCLRETPLNRIHLENMLRAQAAGAVIMPAMPSFYHQPKSIDDLVQQFVYRVLAQIDLPQERAYRWQGTREAENRK